MIDWQYFPRDQKIPDIGKQVISCFDNVQPEISSVANDKQIGSEFHDSASNAILSRVAPGLVNLGFRVESNKTKDGKISVPVFFGRRGRVDKSFDADAYHPNEKFVLEVEAGRAVTNYQFLKDLFQASVMVDVDYLAIAVRIIYKKRPDFDTVVKFMDSLYSGSRLRLPLKGVLIIGY